MSLSLSRSDLICKDALLNGRWSAGVEGLRFAVHNPATGEVIADVPDCGASDARAAAEAAHAAFPAWRARTNKERAALISVWHALVMRHADDLGRLITLEQGKALKEGRAEVLYAASYIEWFAEEAKRIYGDVLPSPQANRRLTVVREPVGVVAIVTPWNFPIAMIARKIAPALAAGCTVVAKPAEDTPLSALALVKLAEEAGIPAGVLNIVTASRPRAGLVVDEWLKDARVRKLTFTGSTAVGRHLARESGDTLKKLSLELGGLAPFIVFEDADLPAAIKGLMNSKFRNAGQTCICPNRIYVQRPVYERFAQLLAEKVQALRVGLGEEEGTDVGPLINERAFEKVQAHVQDAIAQGAKAIVGGKRYANLTGGYFFEPTVLVDAKSSMRVSCEETFGPVAPLFSFDTEEEAVRFANDTPFGLAAYFYTQNMARVARLSSALESGMIGINEGALSSEAAPFGGIKASGYGREGSRYGLDEYQHLKYLCQGGLG
ncbi:MAG TPA: NAD-dependent succinate-semialdehyde dehydrogenase [Burkholderiales bacterium]|nr:NAD-dependent succinate-semialdehyde dehydrogenase [Burkholderiales bacterium]